jgi:hypothetical protein
LKDAGQYSHAIRFFPLAHIFRLAWPPFVEEGLDIALGQRDSGRASIDHAADCGAVTLAKTRHTKEVPECIEGHRYMPEISDIILAFPNIALSPDTSAVSNFLTIAAKH